MLEDFMAELAQPIRAIKLLTIFTQEQIFDECIFDINKNKQDKKYNTLALNYAIGLVCKDISKLKKKYYKKLCKTKYNR